MAKEKVGFWAGLAAVIFHPITRLAARREALGLEHLPASGPALLVCNHISYLDPVYTAVFVHLAGRVPRFLAKDSLWRVPVLRGILTGSGQIPVSRTSTDAGRSLSAAAGALADGKVVVIYPEGTITRDPDTWPMASHTGVARLALSSSAPVVPAVHWGTHRVYDHYRRRFRPLPRKQVVLRAGPPVDLTGYRERLAGSGMDAALLREVTDYIMGAVRDVLAEVRGEPAPASFYTRSQRTDTRSQRTDPDQALP